MTASTRRKLEGVAIGRKVIRWRNVFDRPNVVVSDVVLVVLLLLLFVSLMSLSLWSVPKE